MDTNFVSIDFSNIYYFYFHIKTDFKLRKRHRPRPRPLESFSQNNKNSPRRKPLSSLKVKGTRKPGTSFFGGQYKSVRILRAPQVETILEYKYSSSL
jgi:hypothetical protein